MHRVVVRAGKLQVDAAAAAGVKVFQFSTQEDVEKRTKVSMLPLCMQTKPCIAPAPHATVCWSSVSLEVTICEQSVSVSCHPVRCNP